LKQSKGKAEFKLQFDGQIARKIEPSLSPPASYQGAGLATYVNTASGLLNSGSIKILVDGKEATYAPGESPVFKANTTQAVTILANPIPYTVNVEYSSITLPGNTPAYKVSIVSAGYDVQAKKAYDEGISSLDNNVKVLITSISAKLEDPLNKASINNKPENLKELDRLRTEIGKLKDPLISILNNLHASDASIDLVNANKTLEGYAGKIDDLQKQVTAFLASNNNLNDLDAKAKAEEAAKKDVVEKDAEFLKNNIPVYIIQDNMYKINSLTFRLAFDTPITPKSSITMSTKVNGKNAEFVGYTNLNGKIDGATLALYVDNIKHDLTTIINKDTTQEIKFTGQDNIPYIARIDYSLKDDLNIIEPSSETVLPGRLLKRAYVITLDSVVEDKLAIEEAQKATAEAKRLREGC
jgi:hypothetical protein